MKIVSPCRPTSRDRWRLIALRWSLALVATRTLVGCDGPRAEEIPESAAAALEEADEQLENPSYPRGRWRLVAPEDLGRVILWVSHILIRHRDVQGDDVSFSLGHWRSGEPLPSRSKAEAFALARRIARMARADGADFEGLARAYSDDVATRDLGGSLGGISAAHFIPWPMVLDTLAAIGMETASGVVETGYGYHVFIHRRPPPETSVTGARIVIGHQNAEWLSVVARGTVPERPQAEALALAHDIYRKLRDAPDQFNALVDQFSEHRDANRMGDFGTWSTREPTPFPREVEVLRRLAVGEVSPPIGSSIGFQLIRRGPEKPRRAFTLTQIRLPFSQAGTGADELSQEVVRSKATEIARVIGKDPSRFDAYQRENCCVGPLELVDGRGDPNIFSKLEGLEPGQISSTPIESGLAYLIVKRLPDASRDSATVSLSLPTPELPDVGFFVSHSGGEFAKVQMEQIGESVRAELNLAGQELANFIRIHDATIGSDTWGSPSARQLAFGSMLSELQRLLGGSRYAQYRAIAGRHFERLILQSADVRH